LAVVNPFAEALTFVDHGARARRDHAKYLALIRVVALLHQHQRNVRVAKCDGQPVEYIEVELGDIAIANHLAHEVLGRSIDDLTPQTRALLRHLDQMAAEAAAQGVARAEYRFGRREVQASTGWSYDAVRVHLGRLLERELVVLHNGGRGQRHRYELVFDGKNFEGPAMPRLIDVASLRPPRAGVADQSIERDDLGGGLDGAWGPVGVGLGDVDQAKKTNGHKALHATVGDEPVNSGTPPKRTAIGSIGSGRRS
jgi:hypothetical protein